jgi:hypothetical protein
MVILSGAKNPESVYRIWAKHEKKLGSYLTKLPLLTGIVQLNGFLTLKISIFFNFDSVYSFEKLYKTGV